ncbi:MBL fold metallo-hydrolase [Candidatus Entotheonella palauensis]|uniref:Metallo-beta-lactamase domain-containing protein n=1 Tax=Candidatus Entotheonella gemina TaxID=1429439 RepID=W4ME28_9BACT|nr:MBL fold metallo-hydrolase [Candidatus Entotheonella palauensis]ETX08473.1 MAG: hypothetical protein ETSY2_05210 [Candidatus Entotheonella gemina]
MKRMPIIIIAILVLAALGGGGWLYVKLRALKAQQLTDDVYMVTGLGGNVGVLRTNEGAVVVDTMTFRMQGQRLQSRAEMLSGGSVRAVINTHYHADHAHGNPGFTPGTTIVATERTRHHLATKSPVYRKEAAQHFLPNQTVEREHVMTIGGKTIKAFYLGRGHTDGDLVVLFVEDRVLHLGDLLFHGFYPNIDLEAGGSVKAWATTLDRVLELEFDHVIPGHGPVTDREGIRAFQRFIRELWHVGEAAAEAGQSLDETLATAALQHDSDFGVIAIPLVMRFDRDFVIRRVWEEATGAMKPGS